MTKTEACHMLADINEALYDSKQQLKSAKLNRLMENDPDRIEWYNNAIENLEQECARYEAEAQAFMAEHADILYD